MIVEIALGIILAVLILAFLPDILALGILAIGVAALLTIVAAVLYFLFAVPVLSLFFLASSLVLGVAVFYLYYLDTHFAAHPVYRKVTRAAQIIGFGVAATLVAGLLFVGALAIYLGLVPLVLMVASLLAAVIVLLRMYTSVFGLSLNQRQFLEKLSLGVKWLPANNMAHPVARDETTRAAGR